MSDTTIKLTNEQAARARALHAGREDSNLTETFEQLLTRIVERGLYDIEYRRKRNKKQWAEFKAWKESQKA